MNLKDKGVGSRSLVITTRETTNVMLSHNGGDYVEGITVILDLYGRPIGMRHWTSAEFDFCPFCGMYARCGANHEKDLMGLYDVENLKDAPHYEWCDYQPDRPWWRFDEDSKKVMTDWMVLKNLLSPWNIRSKGEK